MHIVFLELIIDPSCALIFEAEPGEPDIMTRPPRHHRERLFSWASIALNLFQGLTSLAVCLGIFMMARPGHGDDAARALTFTALVVSIIAIIITNRSRTRSLFAILRTSNRPQWWVVIGTIGLLTIVLTVPLARTLFHVAPLHGHDVAISLTAGVVCLAWFEVLKRLSRKAH